MDHACGTCQHFVAEPVDQPARHVVKGVCSHPAHRTRGARVMISAFETRCRRGFGLDDWAPYRERGSGSGPAPIGGPHDDIVIDERPSTRRSERRTLPLHAPIPIYLDREGAVAD